LRAIIILVVAVVSFGCSTTVKKSTYVYVPGLSIDNSQPPRTIRYDWSEKEKNRVIYNTKPDYFPMMVQKDKLFNYKNEKE